MPRSGNFGIVKQRHPLLKKKGKILPTDLKIRNISEIIVKASSKMFSTRYQVTQYVFAKKKNLSILGRSFSG